MALKIGIVDDKISNRIIIKDKLLRHGQFIITLIAADGRNFLDQMQQLNEDERPQVVLMDIEMPEMDGVAAIATGSTLYPQVKFIVLTIFDDDEKIFKAIKAGAFGYLLKDENIATIADVIQQMQESGAGPISPGIAHKILQLVQRNDIKLISDNPTEKSNLFNLSQRELQILILLSKGLGYKEIGTQLNISVNTAKKHVINIYQKLHVTGRAQALKLAYEKGML
ncbi:MAG TPA: response regulator transcription factor [Segetibacter sp.]|jgi:DNA-binding NarL/FixJ family response regulator